MPPNFFFLYVQLAFLLLLVLLLLPSVLLPPKRDQFQHKRPQSQHKRGQLSVVVVVVVVVVTKILVRHVNNFVFLNVFVMLKELTAQIEMLRWMTLLPFSRILNIPWFFLSRTFFYANVYIFALKSKGKWKFFMKWFFLNDFL